MALKKCKECGKDISSKAELCPHCGAKAPKKTSLVTWLILILILLGIYAANQSPSTSVNSSYTKSAKSQATASTDNKKIQSKKPNLTYSTWSNSTSKDKMTGKQLAYASSPIVEPTPKMKFPYSSINAWLGVGCNGKNEWAYIGFNSAPNLSDTETEDGYNLIKTRIKWDGHIENVTLRAHSKITLHFGSRFILSCCALKTQHMLDMPWFSGLAGQATQLPKLVIYF